MFEFLPSQEQFDEWSNEFTVIPLWTQVAGDLETPVSAYLKIKGEGPSFLLESAEQGQRWGRYSFAGFDLFKILVSKAGDNPTSVDALRALLSELRAPAVPELPPFPAGAVGYLAYDAVRHLEDIGPGPGDSLGVPEAILMCPRIVLAFDHLKQVINVISIVRRGESRLDAIDRATAAIDRLRAPTTYKPVHPPKTTSAEVESSIGRDDYLEKVKTAVKSIEEGDIFQVVPSCRMSKQLQADPFDVYRMLRLLNPSAYMFFIEHPEVTVLGCSPEPLLKVQGSRIVQRPIAGTRPRGRTAQQDEAFEQELLNDDKEKAEHVMLVDLARNDVGRVSEPGSVQVEEFMVVEKYSHVMHLVSQVAGKLRPDVTALEALYASFPAGTVSGAPKIRAMQIIDELEPTRRGPYAGVVGYFDFCGNLDTCIALRTAYVKDGRIYIQAGGGVVADSDPAAEWTETQNKAAVLLQAIGMAEALKGTPNFIESSKN